LSPCACFYLQGFFINTYFLAAAIPVASVLFGGHPNFFKALLMSAELLINTWLLFLLLQHTQWHVFAVVFISIAVSKLLYYTGKYIFISAGLIKGEMVATGLEIQVIITLILAAAVAFFYKRQLTV
jgi:hypothetical protein